jgi:hypothetical protein
MTNQASPNFKSLMMKWMAIGTKMVFEMSIVVIALVLFVKTAHANILVANYGTGYVELWNDDGTPINTHFIPVNSAEGIACSKLPNPVIFVADVSDTHIGVYDLNTGQPVLGKDFTITTNEQGGLSAIAVNCTGNGPTILYAADHNDGVIWAVDLSSCSGGTCANQVFFQWPTSHDLVIGPDGRIYASDFANPGTAVWWIVPWSGTGPWPSSWGTFVLPGVYNGHTLHNPGGLVFDNAGNLWVTDVNNSHGLDAIFEFTGPGGYPYPGKFLNYTPDPGGWPLGMDISPVNPPTPPFDSCRGCIVGVNLLVGKVWQIDPTLCNSTNHTCTLIPFFTTGGYPKYVRFTENCCDSGYVEICKMSCPQNPVSGYFNFFVSNSGPPMGPYSIPVNGCSGAIPIQNGVVTVTEAQQLGIEVTNITAYDYDYLGNQINALLYHNDPFQTCNVNVIGGDVSTETVVGFTNCASGPGELKICKVAGQGVPVGTNFTITAKGFGPPTSYTVQAGPPPNGYCVVAASYPVGTEVLVTEPESLNPGYQVSDIEVAPPDRRGGYQTQASVKVKIDSGTTEVTFTNTKTDFFNNIGTTENPYECGGINQGWPVAGSGSPLGQSYTQAAKFQSALTGSVSQIDLAVTYISGVPNSFYAALYTDTGGQPGTQLAYFPSLTGTMCPKLVTITGISGLSLTSGQNYWMVVGPMVPSSPTYELWNYNSVGMTGPELTSNDGGITWTNNGNVTLGAFKISP